MNSFRCSHCLHVPMILEQQCLTEYADSVVQQHDFEQSISEELQVEILNLLQK